MECPVEATCLHYAQHFQQELEQPAEGIIGTVKHLGFPAGRGFHQPAAKNPMQSTVPREWHGRKAAVWTSNRPFKRAQDPLQNLQTVEEQVKGAKEAVDQEHAKPLEAERQVGDWQEDLLRLCTSSSLLALVSVRDSSPAMSRGCT